MKQVSKEEMRRIRKLGQRKGRADAVRGQPCPVCGNPGMVVHHVFPIRYGGSYGRYNLMATCSGRCHSYLNKASNRYCRRHGEDFDTMSALTFSRRIRRYIMTCIANRDAQREKRRREKRRAEQCE